jgi:prepilin-type N-terminal cleavage/methylation domain-containing protein
MISLKHKQSGFTIIELLIVIIVIGILALLVITTFAGVQQRARNTERETDIKAVHGQIESYYSTNSRYPTLANLQDNTWVQANLKGLDVGALVAPRQTAANTIVGTGGSVDNYVYAPTPSGCDNTATDCTGYQLSAAREGSGATAFTKDDLAGN